jgi:hypothetical protein
VTTLPRIDLDAAENLIKKIRAAEANLAALYEEWNSLSVQSSGAEARANGHAHQHGDAAKKPVPVPRAGSLTGKILAAMKKEPGMIFTPLSFKGRFPGEDADEKTIRGILEKLVFRKYIERVSPAHYRYPAGGA